MKKDAQVRCFIVSYICLFWQDFIKKGFLEYSRLLSSWEYCFFFLFSLLSLIETLSLQFFLVRTDKGILYFYFHLILIFFQRCHGSVLINLKVAEKVHNHSLHWFNNNNKFLIGILGVLKWTIKCSFSHNHTEVPEFFLNHFHLTFLCSPESVEYLWTKSEYESFNL